MPSSPSETAANSLLAALPPIEHRRFLANCELVDLVFDEVLAEPGEPIRHVYFPTDSFIALITTPMKDCASLEVGLVGAEGMLGTALVLGVDISPLHAVVQGRGQALRMSAAAFRRELERCPSLAAALKRYLHATMGQLAQMAACTRFHVVEARLARWLLMTQDRARSDRFHITQEFLAYLLGVRRVGVTKAATALQRRKLIRYNRGDLSILDRVGLEAAACRCYEADIATYAKAMERHAGNGGMEAGVPESPVNCRAFAQ